MTHVNTALWGVLPYLVLAVFLGGTAWRYRYDRFGFTTRSSQLYESRLLRVGGPLFHYGLFLVIGGHVVGLLVPEWFTEDLRVSERLYHLNALVAGGAAGVAALAGLTVLLWRRLRVRAVRAATSRSDVAVHALLLVVLLAGLTATTSSGLSGSYDYRLGVSVWFRSLFALDPDVAAMRAAPAVYQVHALLAMALFALWPFSRLVHAFAAPLGYLARPYVVYRSRARSLPPARAATTTGPGSAAPHRSARRRAR
ncbi:respiratory nitrate reductase subunit gamma [Streptomyces tubbatahanensis]|uniref:Respiratory nitrate reductase subunit gamma n=1 Tax=Streptomyces tubbatahanensis TaxID=2923272 RepID=A0ABY3Y001_9ACTN|nr:respiratory nitrate reductase subunit gamma [Streptomyces tubbatahanensis]UNS99909.1 respiratory nitrate reductase subunit gamma [Streptomyces tubbatahanensis]